MVLFFVNGRNVTHFWGSKMHINKPYKTTFHNNIERTMTKVSIKYVCIDWFIQLQITVPNWLYCKSSRFRVFPDYSYSALKKKKIGSKVFSFYVSDYDCFKKLNSTHTYNKTLSIYFKLYWIVWNKLCTYNYYYPQIFFN